MPKTKQALNKLPTYFKISPKGQNFAKSGHTGGGICLVFLGRPLRKRIRTLFRTDFSTVRCRYLKAMPLHS